jgi:hypothetical protein
MYVTPLIYIYTFFNHHQTQINITGAFTIKDLILFVVQI